MPKPIGKVLLADYDECIEADDATKECEVCLTRGQIRAILAINDYFSWATRWYSQGEISKDKIDAFYSDLTWRLLTVCCCDENQTIERILDPDTGVVMMSTDGGSTFFPDPEDPRNSGVQLPPPVTSGQAADKCAAANSVTRQLQIYVDDILASKANELGLVEVALAIAAIALSIWVAPAWALLPGLIIPLIQQIFAASAAELTAAMNTNAYQIFTCIIYCNMEADGSMTETGFIEAINDMNDQMAPGNALGYNTCRAFMLIYSVLGVNNAAAQGLNYGFNCAGCDCAGLCDNDWEIAGVDHGTIDNPTTIVEDGYYEVTSGLPSGATNTYIILKTPNDSDCCKLVSVTLKEGSHIPASIAYFWDYCGEAFVEGVPKHSGLMPQGQCLRTLQIQGSDTTPITVQIVWEAC